MVPTGLEALGQNFFLGHRSRSLIPVRHRYDERDLADVTNRGRRDPSNIQPIEIHRGNPAMHARMKHPMFILPEAMKAMHALHKSTDDTGISEVLRELVHLRASQINGCSVCVGMHAGALKKSGESDDRLFSAGAGRDTPDFPAAERAALALT